MLAKRINFSIPIVKVGLLFLFKYPRDAFARSLDDNLCSIQEIQSLNSDGNNIESGIGSDPSSLFSICLLILFIFSLDKANFPHFMVL